MRKKSLWNKFNDFLWEGKIEQDTPEKIAETLAHQTEVAIMYIYCSNPSYCYN